MESSPPPGPVQLPLYQLLVYVDSEKFPQKVSLQIADLKGLFDALSGTLGVKIGTISFWDEEFKQYIPMRSLDPLRKDFRGKIWVETAGVKFAQVTEERDPLEFCALRDHVDKLTSPRENAVYQLSEAHRISHPQLEQSFQSRKKRLIDPKVRTMMLFYTNNARPSEQCVQHGFGLPDVPNAGIIFASDIDAQPSLSSNLKFLLCEVAVGKTFTVHQNDQTGPTAGFDKNVYDSMLSLTHRIGLPRLEEWVIFDPEQAIPRYILTCSVVKSQMKQKWNPATMGCDQHPGESLKLWCVTCRKLICPYCLTIGAHKDHDGRDTTEVALFEKQVVKKMLLTLDQTLRRRQGEVAEVERVRTLVDGIMKKGVATIKEVVSELHQLLENEQKQLEVNLEARHKTVVHDLDHVLHELQTTTGDLQKKFTETQNFAELPIETNQQARIEFLSRLEAVLDLLQSPPSYDDPTSTEVKIPELHTTVAYEEAKSGIQSLSLVDARASGSGAPLPASVARVVLDSELSRIRDIETGYIWVVPNAEHHFGILQTKDIFSDAFHLLGCTWEIRVTPQPRDHISVFLHATNHVHRMDFKVTIFSPKGWYVRNAKNWLDSFKGKGWGIKPFADKRTLLDTYVVDGVLKLCITPTSGLY